MAKKKKDRAQKMGAESRGDLTSYELMGLRIKNEILAPAAQRNSSVTIHKLDDESWEDWDLFVEDIQTNEEVSMSHIAPGSVSLDWEKYDSENS